MLEFRVAAEDDLVELVRLLADDFLGQQRESLTDPLPLSYQRAFGAILQDPNNEILVACEAGRVVATLQVTYTPSLSYQGSWRGTIESVRTDSAYRGRGIGTELMHWTIDRARSRGCRLIQLSTNKQRADAFRFYERLGFSATHEGMKMELQ